MAPKTLDTLFHDTLRDVYYAERKALQGLSKMARGAQSEELRAAFETHRDETEGQIERLQRVFEIIGKRAQGKTCAAMDGITEEAEEIMEEYTDSPAARRRPPRRRAGGRALRDHPLRHAGGLGRPARPDRGGGPPARDPGRGGADRRAAHPARRAGDQRGRRAAGGLRIKCPAAA